MDETPKKERPGALAAVIAFLGTLSGFLAAADWNMLLSPEAAAVAATGVTFAGAAAAFAAAIVKYVGRPKQ